MVNIPVSGEAIEVTIRVPRGLMEFLQLWKGERAVEYLENILLSSVKADFGNEHIWLKFFRDMLEKHGLNPAEWMDGVPKHQLE